MQQQRRLPPLSVPRPAFASQGTTNTRDTSDDYALYHEYNTYITQLRGLLEETTEQPPAGVHTADVEHRVALIQSALSEVQRRSDELHWRMELRQNQRLLDTYQRRIQAEEEAEQSRQTAEKMRRAQVEELRSSQVAYYRSRNEHTDAKAIQCRSHYEKVQEDTALRAGSNEERRTRNLENLYAERERKQKELRDREQAKQEYARQVRERRAAKLASQQGEKVQQAQMHRQEMEAKLAAMRDSKRSTWSAKKEASRAKSAIVWENGEAKLETVLQDHDRLVEELEQRQRQQEERYAESKAEQLAYLHQRAQFRATKQERQQETLRKLVDQRLTRGTEIAKEAEKKKEKAELAKEHLASQYCETGKELGESIRRHQQRAQKLQEEEYNETLDKHYRRWNHRAARIVEELQGALQVEKSQGMSQSHRGPQRTPGSAAQRHAWSTRDARNAAETGPYAAVGRGHLVVSLPSPEDFAV